MKLSPTVRASYELLGVAPGTADGDLKKAFHKLALLYHPDRNPSATAASEFQKVTEAYDLLCDPARVADLNRRHLRERLHRPVIEGLEITFGSFFGYRIFDPGGERSLNLVRLTGRSSERGLSAAQEDIWSPFEENNSILDNAAYDAIEAVYAGRFSIQDEEQLMGEVQPKKLAQLPWVVLNNQGILRFFDGDLKGARKCYAELCERVPNNILFMYRLGLCEILDGFKSPRRTLLGAIKPDRIKIERGIQLMKHCLKLGEERTVGRQKCLVIRKTLADVYDRLGKTRKARALWAEVWHEDKNCAEAALKVEGRDEALKLIRRKARRSAADEIESSSGRKRLGPGRAGRKGTSPGV